ncbi:MAG: hypothetical protein DRO11_08030, partial [Methanobacteriota archaeon]
MKMDVETAAKKYLLAGSIFVLILACFMWPEETVTHGDSSFLGGGLARFSSEEEFRDYLERGETLGVYRLYGVLGLGGVARPGVRPGVAVEATPTLGVAKGLAEETWRLRPAGIGAPGPRYSSEPQHPIEPVNPKCFSSFK